MTNSNVPRQRQKPRNPLTLAGKPRNQEAERKRLVREVQRLESDSQYTAEKRQTCRRACRYGRSDHRRKPQADPGSFTRRSKFGMPAD